MTPKRSLLSWTFQVEETDKKQNLKIIPDLMKLGWIGSDLLLVMTLVLACVRTFGSSFSPQFCRVCGESWRGGLGREDSNGLIRENSCNAKLRELWLVPHPTLATEFSLAKSSPARAPQLQGRWQKSIDF